MLYWLFTFGRDLAAYSGVPAITLGASMPLVTAALLAKTRQPAVTPARIRLERIARACASLVTAVGMLHLMVIVLSSLPLQDTNPQRPGFVESIATLLIGPSSSHRQMLAIAGAAVAIAVVLAARAAYLLTGNASALRDYLSLRHSPARRRGELGSAHFCTPHEFQRFSTPDPDGLALAGAFWGQGRWARRLRRLDNGDCGLCLSSEDIARGLLTIGGPGSGKTQSVILPAMADWMAGGRSLVVVDPQNELTPYLSHFAAVTGHQVIIHDPTSANCPRYDLTSTIRNVSEARAVADVMIPVGLDGESGTVWRESAQALLAACMLRFDNVGEILSALAVPKRLARRLADGDDDAKLLATPFIVSMTGDGKLAAQIVATLATALTGWSDEAVRLSTELSDFSADILVSTPTVIVLTCPGSQRTTYARYLGSVLRKLMLDLDAIGEANGGPLPAPVAFIIDEFPTLGKLDTLVADVNLVRKRRIAILIAAQTRGQFHLVYGKEATDALFAGLATQIIFGGCDQETAGFYSRASGLATETLPGSLFQSPQVRQRSLLTPDEIQTPARGNATLFLRYVTETYASQTILFAQLTRLYERGDWQARLAQVGPEDALIVQRRAG